MPTFVLSCHADYICQERGACCTAGWPIPVEEERLRVITDAARTGRLRPPTPVGRVVERTPDGPAVLALRGGACVFHRSAGPGRCEVHRVLGHGALPLACRQFPRVSLHDPRGTSVTLSHYCPTAAAMLDRHMPLEVVADAARFAPDGEYVGLDVRDALPPLLEPDVLMDWESWWRFERESVQLIDRSATTDEALARLAVAVHEIRGWRPGDVTLGAAVAAAFAAARAHAGAPPRRLPVDTLLGVAHAAIPDDFRPPLPALARATRARRDHHRERGYLAAHAFANWSAHLGSGLVVWLRAIEAAGALVEHGFGVGEADLWLRHLVDPGALSAKLSRID